MIPTINGKRPPEPLPVEQHLTLMGCRTWHIVQTLHGRKADEDVVVEFDLSEDEVRRLIKMVYERIDAIERRPQWNGRSALRMEHQALGELVLQIDQ